MNDLISRQAAIDALRTCYDTESVTYTNGNEYINYEQALDLIDELTSAQPKGKKGVFIPDITVEMFRNAPLNGVEAIMAEGEMYDIVFPSAQPEIGYEECSNAMLKMWMDNVLTDGEYNRIMDKLNKFNGGQDG